jgi:hypothetical protein
VKISEPDAEPVISWQWKLNKTDSGWEIDFKNITVNAWIEQEINRLNNEREQSLERERILREGLRLKLVPLSESFTIGKPMEFRLEVTNISDSTIEYDETESYYMVNDPMTIHPPDGTQVEYISGSTQTLAFSKTIDPNQTVVIREKFDAASNYHISKPGIYKFQFTGYSSTIVKSNVVEMNIAEGEPSTFDKIYSVLKPIIPDDWEITQRRIRDIEHLNLKDDNGISIVLISDYGKKAVEGFVGIYLLINPSQAYLETTKKEAELFGKSQWGDVYINSKDAETLWPDYREQIIKVLDIKSTGVNTDLQVNKKAEEIAESFIKAVRKWDYDFITDEKLNEVKTEIYNFAQQYISSGISELEYKKLINAIENYGLPRSKPDDPASLKYSEEIGYFQFPDQVDTFKWLLWRALIRQPQAQESIKQRQLQH